SKVAKSDSEHARAKDLIGELVHQVLDGTVIVSDNLSATIDARVAELDRAGLNVCFGQDSIKDPWYPLGNGNILRVLDAGLHICHMMGYQDLQRCLDFVTDHSATALHLGDGYGIAVGRPANLVVLDADS
ncbi:amidohydrolase family protein, partial [Listeria monocytogenes]|uniref:amidohydrolase family protein n=1 Tax=Listeria monocytogenes TaxID=1639 RepID=UPI003F6757E1